MMPFLNAQLVRIRRYTKQIVDGVKIVAVAGEIEIRLSIQPIKGNDLKNLPEGFRRLDGNKWKIYAPSELQTGDQDAIPDVIIFNGREIHIHSKDDFKHGLLPHYRYFAFEPQTQ
jgi:hypothetical protein